MSADAAVHEAFASLTDIVRDIAEEQHVDMALLLTVLADARGYIQAAVDEQDAELIEVRRLLHYRREFAEHDGAMPSADVDVRTTDALVLRAVTETLQPVVGHDLAIRCADEVILVLDGQGVLR